MIRLTDINGEQHPLTAYDNFHIKHKYDGCDVMSFCVDTAHEQYKLLHEECKIVTDGNEWLIKKIDDDKIDCELNFDFLKTTVYSSYKSETRSLSEVLESHLPEGWVIVGANISTIRRTIEFDFCTDFDVVMQCLDTYKVCFVWLIKEKRVIVHKPDAMMPTGEYVTSELNLRSLSFKGSSTEFATRLYAYGKDGMTMEEAMVDDGNGGTVRYGLPYVENHSYAEKTVCAYWSDDRYTVPENLYADALELLGKKAIPERSYECDVVDLAKQDSRYAFLEFAMHKKITLIDVERNIKVEHQIVEYDEWPDESNENSVTLSCVPQTIQTTVKSMVKASEETTEKVKTSLDQRIMMATAMLTGAFGGHFYTSDGELYIMDSDDPATAEIVWRWNINGFGKSSTGINGPYTTAMTFDDTFITNVVNAMIIRGALIEGGTVTADKISQSYTDGVLNECFEIAEGRVTARFSDITNKDGTGILDTAMERVTTIEETINEMTFDFEEAFRGGINYIQNSCGLNGLSDDWETDGTVVTLQNDDTKNSTVSNSCFRLSVDSSLSQTLDNIIPGQTYVVCLKVKKTDALLSEVKLIYNGDKEAIIFSSSETSRWTEYFVVLDDIESNNIELVATTRSSYLYISDIMLCEGTSPKAWAPAPNEIFTSGVRIDKTGIVVYRSDTSEKTVMNNREFAGYYNDEEVFSLNKDETRTKKTVVDGELTVGDCKFIPYENGTEEGLNIALLD